MPQVNGDNLLHQQIVKRTIEALQAQDEAFAIEYETVSDADLIAYVRQCVDVSYTPAPCEVVGGAYIAQRFGNWSAALKAAETAKAAFDEAGLKKLPKAKDLSIEYAELLKKKKEAYPDYRKARDEMQELMKAQKNVEMFFAEEKDTAEKEPTR